MVKAELSFHFDTSHQLTDQIVYEGLYILDLPKWNCLKKERLKVNNNFTMIKKDI